MEEEGAGAGPNSANVRPCQWMLGAGPVAPMPAGEWINPEPGRQLGQRDASASALWVRGSCGSTWATPALRRAQGWAEASEPTNVYALAPSQPSQWEATVTAVPLHHGEQAGLYAYASAASWVKLVVEGAGGGGKAFLGFAEQREGSPTLRGKMPLPQFSGTVSLRLVQGERGTVRGLWRIGADAPWAVVTRGLGWLEQAELMAEGVERGSLPVGDPRGEAVAECSLPQGWRAALLTEQWQDRDGAEVCFAGVLATAKPMAPSSSPSSSPGNAKCQRSVACERLLSWHGAVLDAGVGIHGART